MNLYNHLISWRVPVRFILKLNWNKYTHLYSALTHSLPPKLAKVGIPQLTV